MLRPASLLPALSQAFDAPLWPGESLPPTGACYRALRRLPGRISHPLEQHVFQDAPCLLYYCRALRRRVRWRRRTPFPPLRRRPHRRAQRPHPPVLPAAHTGLPILPVRRAPPMAAPASHPAGIRPAPPTAEPPTHRTGSPAPSPIRAAPPTAGPTRPHQVPLVELRRECPIGFISSCRRLPFVLWPRTQV
jgi:hypothetical protein